MSSLRGTKTVTSLESIMQDFDKRYPALSQVTDGKYHPLRELAKSYTWAISNGGFSTKEELERATEEIYSVFDKIVEEDGVSQESFDKLSDMEAFVTQYGGDRLEKGQDTDPRDAGRLDILNRANKEGGKTLALVKNEGTREIALDVLADRALEERFGGSGHISDAELNAQIEAGAQEGVRSVWRNSPIGRFYKLASSVALGSLDTAKSFVDPALAKISPELANIKMSDIAAEMPPELANVLAHINESAYVIRSDERTLPAKIGAAVNIMLDASDFVGMGAALKGWLKTGKYIPTPEGGHWWRANVGVAESTAGARPEGTARW